MVDVEISESGTFRALSEKDAQIERLTAELNHANQVSAISTAHERKLGAENEGLIADCDMWKAENERLTSQVEWLQNKCANRGLSPEDSDALQARVEKLTAEASRKDAAIVELWTIADTRDLDAEMALYVGGIVAEAMELLATTEQGEGDE